MEKRPEAPRWSERRFQIKVVFLDEQQVRGWAPLAPECLVYVLAHDLAAFHLKLLGRLREPVRQMAIAAERSGAELGLRRQPAAIPPVPW